MAAQLASRAAAASLACQLTSDYTSANPYSAAASRASRSKEVLSWQNAAFVKERSYQCRHLRDVIYFRSVTINSAWLAWNEGTVRKVAQAIYDERAFDRMPILADALEEAGCTNTDILAHCRQPGEHVRGCWVVDIILLMLRQTMSSHPYVLFLSYAA